MRRITLKIAIAFLAFAIGVVFTAFWFIFPQSLNQVLEVSTDVVVTEEAEEYAVYSAAINHLFVKDKDIGLFAISNQTSFYGDERHKAIYGDDYIKIKTTEQRVRHLKENYPSVNEETLFDYDSKMMKPHILHSKFNLSVEYNLTNKDNYEKDNVIKLSKVGFNREVNQGFVYIGFICPALCSRGDYLLLEKVNGIWTVKEIFDGFRS